MRRRNAATQRRSTSLAGPEGYAGHDVVDPAAVLRNRAVHARQQVTLLAPEGDGSPAFEELRPARRYHSAVVAIGRCVDVDQGGLANMAPLDAAEPHADLVADNAVLEIERAVGDPQKHQIRARRGISAISTCDFAGSSLSPRNLCQ
jgi:hypothetical protein